MVRLLRNMVSTVGGTLALLFIDTISFCVALRLFISQSLAETPDKKLMILGLALAFVVILVTNRLLSSKKNLGLPDYAKDEGFDSDSEALGLSAESINFQVKEDYYALDDEDAWGEEEIETFGNSEEESTDDGDTGGNTVLSSEVLHRVEFGSTDDSKNDINNLLDNSETNIKKPHSRGFEDDFHVDIDFNSESIRGFGDATNKIEGSK